MDKLITIFHRYRYKRAMFKAINQACESCGMFKQCNKAGGMRVIKTFERVNKIAFDPFDQYHVSMISGMGPMGSSIRMVRIALGKITKEQHND